MNTATDSTAVMPPGPRVRLTVVSGTFDYSAGVHRRAARPGCRLFG